MCCPRPCTTGSSRGASRTSPTMSCRRCASSSAATPRSRRWERAAERSMAADVTMTPISQTTEWKALQAHHDEVRDVHLRQLFAEDPSRGERLALEVEDLFLDYSKNRVTD